jgi:putative acetyltransferase
MLVRRYERADRDAARRIHVEAFRRKTDPAGVPPEVGLFEALTDEGWAVEALSFVALRDGTPVGHVMCSRATIAPHPVVALGPIGVLPSDQGQGVGLAMMHTVLGAADALDVPLIVLLGSTSYYPRFGFRPAVALCIQPPEPDWGDHFQARTLTTHDASITGPFRYAPPFDNL